MVKSTETVGYFATSGDEEGVLLNLCILVSLNVTQRSQLASDSTEDYHQCDPGSTLTPLRLIFNELANFQSKDLLNETPKKNEDPHSLRVSYYFVFYFL